MAKVIKNMNELNTALEKQLYDFVDKAANKVKELIDSFIMLYYDNYRSPKYYERTYQFLDSCVRSDVIKNRNGYSAMIYIDTANLDYYEASGQDVVNWANQGLHGGCDVGDTSEFWNDSLEVINKGYLVKLFGNYMKEKGFKVSLR